MQKYIKVYNPALLFVLGVALLLKHVYLQGDQNSCLGVSHIKTTPFVQKKSCWLPQDTQGH